MSVYYVTREYKDSFASNYCVMPVAPNLNLYVSVLLVSTDIVVWQ